MVFRKNVIFILFFIIFFNVFLLETDADEKIESEKTKIDLTISKEKINTNEETIKNVKIDDNTTAKITISAKETEQSNKIISTESTNKSNENKIQTTQIGQNEKNIQNINIVGKIDLQNPQSQNIITINDGVKSININIKPEIIGCNNCNKNVPTKKKVNKKIKTTKKTTKIEIKKNKINKKSDIVPITPITNQENENLDSKKAQENKKTYNNTELSCAGEECKNAVIVNNNKPIERIIEKETKIVNQPVYVVNRIINIDEDMNLSEDAINQMAIDTNGSVSVVGDTKPLYSQSSKNYNTDRFKQQYDIIASTKLSYGEVAFIDDYND